MNTDNHKYSDWEVKPRLYVQVRYSNLALHRSPNGKIMKYQVPAGASCRVFIPESSERVICRPEFDHKLSASEMPVLRLWYGGLSIDDIARQLCLSPHTVNNHIRHAYRRLNIHSRAEFVRYATLNNLFS